MNEIGRPDQIELDPIEIDTKPCELCGYTIDRHEMVDDGGRPLFFCADLETLIHLRVADLVKQWELADPRDAWRHTDDPAPPADVRNSHIGQKPQPYRTPQATTDAFWCVVGLSDPQRFKAWLANHPEDAPSLIKLLESK